MTPLAKAVRLLGEVRSVRLLAGDHQAARLLERLAELVAEEADVLEGVERWGLPSRDPVYPDGATVGWFLRHDAATRKARRLHGLPLPLTTPPRAAEARHERDRVRR